MSQDIGDSPNLRNAGSAVFILGFRVGLWVLRWVGSRCVGSRVRSRRSSPVMALTTRMCEVVDEQDDVGSGVGSADADVVQSAVVAQGDGAGFVDAVVTDPVVGVGVAASRRAGLWASSRRASRGWRGGAVSGAGGRWLYSSTNASSRVCSSSMVAGWTGWARSHFFMVCWKRLDFAAGGGVVGSGVLLDHVPGVGARSRRRCGRRGRRRGGRCRPCRCRSGSRRGCRAGLRFRGRWRVTIGAGDGWWAVTCRA